MFCAVFTNNAHPMNTTTAPAPAAVIQVWDDLHNERPGYFRAYWTSGPDDTTGCTVIGYCSPGGSHRTIRAVVAEVRRLGYTDPVYRNGRRIA